MNWSYWNYNENGSDASLRKTLNRVLITEALSPLLFVVLLSFWTLIFNPGAVRVPSNHTLFQLIVLALGTVIGNLIIFFWLGLPFWLLFIVGKTLNRICFVILSIFSLIMCVYSLSCYYVMYAPGHPNYWGEEGFIYIAVFTYQLGFVMIFSPVILGLNWILRKMLLKPHA